jgi:hypothetical protein
MGRAVIDAAAGRTDVKITAAVDRADAPGIGAAINGVTITSSRRAMSMSTSRLPLRPARSPRSPRNARLPR